MKKIWVILAGMVLGFAAYGSSQEEGLVGYWKFDEGNGANVSDSSGAGNNGTIINEMKNVKWVTGRIGNALHFTGNPEVRGENGGVVIPAMDKYDFSKGMTIEAWIKLDPTVKRKNTYEIVSNTVSDRGPGFRFMISWASLMFGSGEGGTDGKFWCAYSHWSKTKIQPDIWYHIAGTYDGSTFRVYLDGELVGESEANLQLTKGRTDIYIGSYNRGYAYGFEGIIDEVKIYTTALSSADIIKHAKLQ